MTVVSLFGRYRWSRWALVCELSAFLSSLKTVSVIIVTGMSSCIPRLPRLQGARRERNTCNADNRKEYTDVRDSDHYGNAMAARGTVTDSDRSGVPAVQVKSRQ